MLFLYDLLFLPQNILDILFQKITLINIFNAKYMELK